MFYYQLCLTAEWIFVGCPTHQACADSDHVCIHLVFYHYHVNLKNARKMKILYGSCQTKLVNTLKLCSWLQQADNTSHIFYLVNDCKIAPSKFGQSFNIMTSPLNPFLCPFLPCCHLRRCYKQHPWARESVWFLLEQDLLRRSCLPRLHLRLSYHLARNLRDIT